MKRSDELRGLLTSLNKEYREKRLFLLAELDNALGVELQEFIKVSEKEREIPCKTEISMLCSNHSINQASL